LLQTIRLEFRAVSVLESPPPLLTALGPLVAMFLIPQPLPKEIYVGTTVLFFAWIKFVFWFPTKL